MAKRNVFLFVPNLIGYARILLLGCSFYLMLDNYLLAIALYSLSYVMDAFDGFAARLFNQSSVFGSMLDMLTDRVSTMCLLMTLGHLYKEYFFIFQLLLIIDIVSHWLHFFTASLEGKKSHKISDKRTNPLMRIYYENKIMLTTVCAMEQLFYCSMLVYYHERNNYSLSPYLLGSIIISSPFILFKNYVNLLQALGACRSVAAIE